MLSTEVVVFIHSTRRLPRRFYGFYDSTIRLINQLPFPVSDEFTPALLATPTCPAVVLTKAEALAKAADF